MYCMLCGKSAETNAQRGRYIAKVPQLQFPYYIVYIELPVYLYTMYLVHMHASRVIDRLPTDSLFGHL